PLLRLPRARRAALSAGAPAPAKPVTSERSDESAMKPATSTQNFNERFAHEVSAIGTIDDHPAETEAKLREWAKSLSPDQLSELASKALDSKLNGDDRFLAAQLLGWAESPGALPYLENIATTSIPPLKDERALSFEVALRGLAIESIRQAGHGQERLTALSRVAGRVEHPFLNDRAVRTIASVRSPELPEPAEQDAEALAKLADR
ncbi:MAG: hypothetical protein ABL958_21820, partial [Bdellovibrionia bacterium]